LTHIKNATSMPAILNLHPVDVDTANFSLYASWQCQHKPEWRAIPDGCPHRASEHEA